MTLAHPAAVLPFARTRLPMPALVAGSMLPDVPVFLNWHPRTYAVTHSVVGVFGVDMVATCAVVALWVFVLRDALVDMAPPGIRGRFVPVHRPEETWWLLVPLAAWIGAGTHLLWDSFTHADRWGPRHLPWLDATWHGRALYRWLQYGSGLVGLAIVLAVIVLAIASRPTLGAELPRRLPGATLPAAVGAGLAVGALAALRSVPLGLRDMAFNGVVDGVVSSTALVAAACLLWQATHLLSPARRRPGPRR